MDQPDPQFADLEAALQALTAQFPQYTLLTLAAVEGTTQIFVGGTMCPACAREIIERHPMTQTHHHLPPTSGAVN